MTETPSVRYEQASVLSDKRLAAHPRVGALGAERCLPCALRLQGFTHARFKALHCKRFEQIVAGAGLHDLDGILDAADQLLKQGFRDLTAVQEVVAGFLVRTGP